MGANFKESVKELSDEKVSLRYSWFWNTYSLMFLRILPLARAQEVPQPQPGRQGGNISDQELRAFAKAYIELQEIRQRHEFALKGFQNPKEMERVLQEAVSGVEDAFERQGLSVESYNRILVGVNGDERPRKKTFDLIETEQKRVVVPREVRIGRSLTNRRLAEVARSARMI